VLDERRRHFILHKSLNDESNLGSKVKYWVVELPAVTYMGVELPAVKDPSLYSWYRSHMDDFESLSEYDKLCFLQIQAIRLI